jgi:hypothetical protein
LKSDSALSIASDQLTGTCKTQHERIVAFLWSTGKWHPTHELQGVLTPYGFFGNAGHTRARELARNECPDKLKGKVKCADGRDIGLDKRFRYGRKYVNGEAVGLREVRGCEIDAGFHQVRDEGGRFGRGGPGPPLCLSLQFGEMQGDVTKCREAASIGRLNAVRFQ